MTARPENKFLLEQFMETSTCECVLIDRSTGMEMFVGTLESNELNHETTEEEIRGGLANDVLTTIRKGRKLSFKISDILSRMDLQSAKLGASIKNGEIVAWQFDKAITVKLNVAKKEVTLDQIPLSADKVSIYNSKTKRLLVPTTDYTITGKVVEIKSVDINANDNVYVGAYEYTTTADYMDISNKLLPSSYTLIINSPLYDLNDQIVATKQYFFPKAKMSGSFTLKGNTEKTKNVEDTTFSIEKDMAYDYLGRISFLKEAVV